VTRPRLHAAACLAAIVVSLLGLPAASAGCADADDPCAGACCDRRLPADSLSRPPCCDTAPAHESATAPAPCTTVAASGGDLALPVVATTLPAPPSAPDLLWAPGDAGTDPVPIALYLRHRSLLL
jgi:hypothetical protein